MLTPWGPQIRSPRHSEQTHQIRAARTHQSLTHHNTTTCTHGTQQEVTDAPRSICARRVNEPHALRPITPTSEDADCTESEEDQKNGLHVQRLWRKSCLKLDCGDLAISSAAPISLLSATDSMSLSMTEKKAKENVRLPTNVKPVHYK